MINKKNHSNKGLETPKLLSVLKRVDWFLFIIIRVMIKRINLKFLNSKLNNPNKYYFHSIIHSVFEF